MTFNPKYHTTLIGSVPYTDTVKACEQIADAVDVPLWPQMVKTGFRENMYTQFGAVLPGIVIDDANEKITFDTSGDIAAALEQFYTPYLEENVDYFALPANHADGFYRALDVLRKRKPREPYLNWVKGHVTGPISMGLTITDQDARASLYNESLADVLVKNAAMNARWQVRELKTVRSNAIIFVDEPYLVSFGSAFVSLSREQVIAMLDEVFQAIHVEGALAGVHCCGNTDWSVLLATEVDILNLDAFGYLENLSLYSQDLRRFLDRGGIVAWGIVPNNPQVLSVNAKGLADQLRHGISQICEKAAASGIVIRPEEFDTHSMLTPACGLGTETREVSDQVLSVLVETGEILRAGT